MKKPMHLLLRLIIVFGLIFALGGYLAGLLIDDPVLAKDTVRQTYISALFIVPIYHFLLRRRYSQYLKKQG